VEDVHEALVGAVPGIQFGLAFCESSGPALVRSVLQASWRIGQTTPCGLRPARLCVGTFPINVLNAVKMVPEVCRIYCATANPVEVILAETQQGRGILGVVDGVKTRGLETEQDVAERKALLRKFGYKA
jgi:adenosine/AMP kinase